MRISQKLILGFIGIASLVGVVGAVAIKYNTEIILDVDQILLGNSNEAKAAIEITYHIQSIQTNINKLLFENIDGRPEHKKDAKRAIGDSISKLQQFTLLWEDAIKLKIELSRQGKQEKEAEEEERTFRNLKTKMDALILLVNKTVALQEEQGAEAARSFFDNEVEPLLLETQKSAKDLEKSTRENVITDTEKIREAVSNSTGIIILSTVIGLLAVIVVRHFIWKTISNPITELKDATAKIGKGELETEIQINSHDEIGALAQSFNDMTRKLKESRASLEEEVRERTNELSAANAKLQKEINGHSSAQEALQQHIKQLNCLYGLSKLVERPKISLEEIFQETAHLIRNAYQHPDAICARITFEGIYYKTDNFRKSESSQYAQIKIHGEKAGVVEVYYIGEETKNGKSPFLKEERDLLDAIAEHLGRIAGRRQTSEKLELLRNLIDRSNDCIFIIEPKWGRFLDANDRACASLGYTREELLDMTFKDIEESIPDNSSWQEQMDELKFKADFIIQGQHKRKDGTTFFAETSLNLVSQKKEDFIIAIARDVTDRKRAEQRQAQLLQQVESVNQELKDFAYIVSHDLKAPLRGIKTLAEWMSTDYADKLDKNGKEQMVLLLNRVQRMHNLIDGVLQYSRVGRIKEKLVQVNLNEIVPAVIDMVAPPENITITVEHELPTLMCEETRIMQVFQNLLSNAVKYMDKPKGLIKIGCVEEDGFWKFSVADNGPGIEEKHFERIFKIFQTLAPRDEFESTGIGLTVVKKIVELYNGQVWVESKVGEGSTFFFTLPKNEIEVEDAKLEANIIG